VLEHSKTDDDHGLGPAKPAALPRAACRFCGYVRVTAAIFCAALLTGESLQASLRAGLRARLGAIRSVALLTDGVFPADMAQRLPGSEAALLLRGELLNAEGVVCASDAQVIGRPGPPDEGRAALKPTGACASGGYDGRGAFRQAFALRGRVAARPVNASRLSAAIWILRRRSGRRQRQTLCCPPTSRCARTRCRP
jgi:hypothetical protein